MRKKLSFVGVVSLTVLLIACGRPAADYRESDKAETSTPIVEEEPQEAHEKLKEESKEEALQEDIPIVFGDNKKINLFINNFNDANADDMINADEIEKIERPGRAKNKYVNVLKEEGFEISLSDSYPFQVFIKGHESQDIDTFKNLVFKYSKGMDPTLTDEKLEEYWVQTLEEMTHISKFEEFKLRLYFFHDQIEYLTIEGEVQE